MAGNRMERRVDFKLFNQEFSFYTDAPQDEVERIISTVRSELDEGGHNFRTAMPSSKMLVLVCLKLAARYVQLEREYEQFRARQGESIDKLINKVSSGME